MTALTENHKSVLLSRLRRIDNLLRELEYRTQPDSIESVFEGEISDWTCKSAELYSIGSLRFGTC